MKDTTFYPTEEQRKRLVTAYAKSKEGALESVPPRPDFGTNDRPPQGNGGLFSTARDYALFCQMLLNGGSLKGKKYLSADALKFLNTPQTPKEMPTGFFQNDTYGNRGRNYGWGLGTCVLKQPHDGVAEVLSPGTFGHGGAWGTQAWIDPLKGVAYVLMVQRSNFPNSDASDVRQAFQKAASQALAKK
jgi:CubicO group peptidase (beta-lactamase class C family)